MQTQVEDFKFLKNKENFKQHRNILQHCHKIFDEELILHILLLVSLVK